MRIPHHGAPPYLGKTDGPFKGFWTDYPPPLYYIGNFSHLTPYLGNIMVTPILFFFYSSGSGNVCTYVTITFGGGPTTDVQYNKGPIPFSPEAIEGSANMFTYKSYPLFS